MLYYCYKNKIILKYCLIDKYWDDFYEIENLQ